jgi:hypothetical protein
MAFRHRHLFLAVDIHLHDGLRHGLDIAVGVEAALDHAAEAVDREEGRNRFERAARQKLEARIRALIGIAFRLTLLDERDQRIEAGIVSGDIDAAPLQFGDEIRLAALVGDHNAAAVADRLRRDMLVGRRLLGDR